MNFGINWYTEKSVLNTELKSIENIERGTNLSFSSLIKTKILSMNFCFEPTY